MGLHWLQKILASFADGVKSKKSADDEILTIADVTA
jgi:hypothetical protein